MHIFKLLSIYVSFRKVGKDLILPSSQNRLPLNNVRKCERCESATIYLYLTHKHANKSNMERKRLTFMQYILPTPPPSIMSKFKTNQVPNYLRNVEKD